MSIPDSIIANYFKLPEDSRVNTECKLEAPKVEGDPAILLKVLQEKTAAQPPQSSQNVPQIPSCTVDGYTLPLGDPITILLYWLTQYAKKDIETARILNQFKLTVKDLNGKPIYPPPPNDATLKQ